ncbi:MAG: ABC transporter ATP-binding protein [Actinomycetia bacterium]|nr:ABC transporter ATP-binding protein [Actinomycetes bacterium]
MSSDQAKIVRTDDTDNPVAVRLADVTKTYRLYKSERARFMAVFLPKVRYEEVHASDALSFTIRRGESVALLGNNGAGKSTALKIITGVCTPEAGEVEIHGRVSALLDLSAGFDQQLTGRENLMLRGRLWGLSQAELVELMPEIIDFAELGTFIDQPMRTYSSGMRSRLGFAFASSINPDILILDEVLSVGDRNFGKKSLARMQQIMTRQGVTLLFVTHSLGSAKEFCQRGIVLDHGSNVYDGPVADAIKHYESMGTT